MCHVWKEAALRAIETYDIEVYKNFHMFLHPPPANTKEIICCRLAEHFPEDERERGKGTCLKRHTMTCTVTTLLDFTSTTAGLRMPNKQHRSDFLAVRYEGQTIDVPSVCCRETNLTNMNCGGHSITDIYHALQSRILFIMN